MKNPCLVTVNPSQAYEVWQAHGWTWKVLKKYQAPDTEAKNPYARWFCLVTSPLCPQGEMGDCYVKDITSTATRVA